MGILSKEEVLWTNHIDFEKSVYKNRKNMMSAYPNVCSNCKDGIPEKCISCPKLHQYFSDKVLKEFNALMAVTTQPLDNFILAIQEVYNSVESKNQFM